MILFGRELLGVFLGIFKGIIIFIFTYFCQSSIVQLLVNQSDGADQIPISLDNRALELLLSSP